MIYFLRAACGVTMLSYPRTHDERTTHEPSINNTKIRVHHRTMRPDTRGSRVNKLMARSHGDNVSHSTVGNLSPAYEWDTQHALHGHIIVITCVFGIEAIIEYTSIISININITPATPRALFEKRLFWPGPVQVENEAKETEGKRERRRRGGGWNRFPAVKRSVGVVFHSMSRGHNERRSPSV